LDFEGDLLGGLLPVVVGELHAGPAASAAAVLAAAASVSTAVVIRLIVILFRSARAVARAVS
jgi:hypothetical protein